MKTGRNDFTETKIHYHFLINNKPTGGYVNASQLWNKNGIILSKQIERGDVKSWVKLLKQYSKSSDLCIINRLAFLRKHIELHNDTDDVNIAYNLISSLQHGYSKPMQREVGTDNLFDMTCESINIGVEYINRFINDFSYNDILKDITNEQHVIKCYQRQTNGYLKLQIFRTFIEMNNGRAKINDNNLLKYIDETYHIENDYIYFLDLEKFEIVPEHIICSCDEFIQKQNKL